MCYNSNCRIEIKSCIDGVESKVSLDGKVTKCPSEIRFDYALDSDRCTLSVTDNEAVQLRQGEQNIKLIFKKGETSECSLSSGGFLGTFHVFTQEMQMTDDGKSFLLLIVYTLGEQKTELRFSAEYK